MKSRIEQLEQRVLHLFRSEADKEKDYQYAKASIYKQLEAYSEDKNNESVDIDSIKKEIYKRLEK